MRTAVVTGAGTGIGRAVAAALHADGHHVVATGRRPDPLHDLAAELGDRITPLTFDATDPHAVDAALADLLRVDLPQGVDVLVNNAGGNTDLDHPPRDERPSLADTAAAWRANLDANLISAVLVTDAVRDRLRPGGAVVHIGSIAADKGAGAYGAAKAGLASWTIDLANQLGSQDVTVNTVSPGYVAGTEFFRDRLTDERRTALIRSAATGRASGPSDIAALVAFLASPGARQITGQCLAVNGGERMTR